MNDTGIFEFKPASFGWFKVVVRHDSVSLTPHRGKDGPPLPTRQATYADIVKVVLKDRITRRSHFNQLSLKSRDGSKVSIGCVVGRMGAGNDDGRIYYSAAAAVLRELVIARPGLAFTASMFGD